MQTLIFLLILFGVAIAGILLYLNQKNSHLKKLENGICPSCGAEPTTFFDEEKRTTFRVEPIKKDLLKNNGCSGKEIRYKCTKCNLVEVHSI